MPSPTTAIAEFDLDVAMRLRVVVGRLNRGLRRTKAGESLTSTESTVLATVARLGPIGLGELAAEEGLNPTMLSRVLRRLEEQRLVARRSDPTDARAALVEASVAGKRLHERIRSEKTDLLVRLLADLQPLEKEALTNALGVLEAVAEGLKGPKP